MLLEPDVGGRNHPVGDGEQSDLATAMSTPVHGDRFQAEIKGGEMGAGRDADVVQDRGSEVPAQPWRVLQYLDGVQASRATMACSTCGK